MSYETRRFKGPCSKCIAKSYRNNMCFKHYKETAAGKLHCTVLKCIRPIFATTLCRTHFKLFNSRCRIPDCCNRPLANTMCNYHYRSNGGYPPLRCRCNRKIFIGKDCFIHYLENMPLLRKCKMCNRMQVCKGLCKKHYMGHRRAHASFSPENI